MAGQRRAGEFRDHSSANLLMYGSVAGTAVAITALTGYDEALVARAVRATITARTGGVMITYDGTTPTATKGHYIGANQTLVLSRTANVGRLKMIREASTSADVTVTIEE